MKKKNLNWIYILLLLCVGVASCTHEAVPTYNDVSRIYFKYAGESGGGVDADKMSINMGYDIPLRDDSVIYIPFKLMGQVADVDREVKAELITEESSVIEGEELEILPAFLPAGKIYGSLPVKLKRTERVSKNMLFARICLRSNENFHTDYATSYSDPGGDRNGLIFNIYFTAVADKPTLWIGSASAKSLTMYFGAYSNEKIVVMCEACGFTRDYFMIDPADKDPTGKATLTKRFPNSIIFGLISMTNRYLAKWKQEHGGQPRLDENGAEIKMPFNYD